MNPGEMMQLMLVVSYTGVCVLVGYHWGNRGSD
jgi:hypothetical protein